MKQDNHNTKTLQALHQYGFIYNLSGRVNPDSYYRLTTYDHMPAIQQDPHGQYFGMFGAELLSIIDSKRHS